MIAYKLLRVRKDGSLGSLFMARRNRLPIGKWLTSKQEYGAGFKVRVGWHCLLEPVAPHLSTKGRRWFRVKLRGDIAQIPRPQSQGGLWLLASEMKILERVRT